MPSAPTYRPIVFTGAMVRAILADRKTQTRRVVKPQPDSDINPVWLPEERLWQWATKASRRACPYGQPGDRLWVKETWQDLQAMNIQAEHEAVYRATDPDWESYAGWKWRSPRFMPRWASRIDRELTGVRVERVQEISEQDAIAEGIFQHRDGKFQQAEGVGPYTENPLLAFRWLWDALNANRGFSWQDNPWVWVNEFKRLEQS